MRCCSFFFPLFTDPRNFSFKGAWVSEWELEQCEDVFGGMDVVADSLPALADGIIAAAAKA
jgi:hypothetical protein